MQRSERQPHRGIIMIKKLRRKIVLINMSLVSVVLIIAFVTVFISSYNKSIMNMKESLGRVLMFAQHPPEDQNIKFEIGKPNQDVNNFVEPFFIVTLTDMGEIDTVSDDNVEVSNEVLNEAVETVLSKTDSFGTISSLNLAYSVLDTPTGQRIAFLDITNQKQTIANLLMTSLLVGVSGLLAFFFISLFLARLAIKPVELAFEQQRQFVADASHELKTPLTVILANTGILMNHKNDTIEQQSKWISYIKAEAERMKKLVEDMLFLAKSDAAKMPCVKSQINFSDISWSCLLPFESLAFEQGVSLESKIDPDIMLQGDEKQLRELIGILVDNACKYSLEKGTVTLTLSKHQDKIKLAVHNTGTYIPEEKQKHLFERFYRMDESRDRKAGGYGLGLAIAKSIVDNHHGKIHVKSSQAKGTTFEIYLPY